MEFAMLAPSFGGTDKRQRSFVGSLIKSTTSAISSITSKVSLDDTLDWHRNDNNGAESDGNETESNNSCLTAVGSTVADGLADTAKGFNNVDVQEGNGDETASITKRHRRVGKSRMRY